MFNECDTIFTTKLYDRLREASPVAADSSDPRALDHLQTGSSLDHLQTGSSARACASRGEAAGEAASWHRPPAHRRGRELTPPSANRDGHPSDLYLAGER